MCWVSLDVVRYGYGSESGRGNAWWVSLDVTVACECSASVSCRLVGCTLDCFNTRCPNSDHPKCVPNTLLRASVNNGVRPVHSTPKCSRSQHAVQNTWFSKPNVYYMWLPLCSQQGQDGCWSAGCGAAGTGAARPRTARASWPPAAALPSPRRWNPSRRRRCRPRGWRPPCRWSPRRAVPRGRLCGRSWTAGEAARGRGGVRRAGESVREERCEEGRRGGGAGAR